MDSTKIPIMGAIASKLNWLSSKQRIISQNIANADTPGYRARTLEEQDFSGLVSRFQADGTDQMPLKMKTTNPKHLLTGGMGAGEKNEFEMENLKGGDPTANNVILEEQLMDMANTQMEFGMMVSLYKKHVSMIRTAIGR